MDPKNAAGTGSKTGEQTVTRYDDLTIGIVGSGGDGVITAGELLVSSAANEGLYCFMLKSYGPQIRGGESSCRVRMSENQVFSQGDQLDILLVQRTYSSQVDIGDVAQVATQHAVLHQVDSIDSHGA